MTARDSREVLKKFWDVGARIGWARSCKSARCSIHLGVCIVLAVQTKVRRASDRKTN